MTRIRHGIQSKWPALMWAVLLIVVPLVLHFVHVPVPGVVAYPVGLLSAPAAALWRFR